MVKSLINPSVEYKETKYVDKPDHNTEASSYDIIFRDIDPNNEITVTFGKLNDTYMSSGLSYFLSHTVPNVIDQVKICVRKVFSDVSSSDLISYSLLVRKLNESRFSIEYLEDSSTRMFLPHIIPESNHIEDISLFNKNQQVLINGMLNELWDVLER